MDTQTLERYRTLLAQFRSYKDNAVTPETTVAVGDRLRFEIDHGWAGTRTEEGSVSKLTDRSIIVAYSTKTARLGRDADSLRRRKVRRLGSAAEWLELKDLTRAWHAAERAEREEEDARRAKLAQYKRDRAAALELLAQEYPERATELLAAVIRERETGGSQQ